MSQPDLPINQWPQLSTIPADRALAKIPIDNMEVNAGTGESQHLDAFQFQNLIGWVENALDLTPIVATSIPDGTFIGARRQSATVPFGIGGGPFYLDKSGALGASAEDGGAVIPATGGTNWYWRRPIVDIVIPQWWGAIPDGDQSTAGSGTDNATALQAWLDFLIKGFNNANIPLTNTKGVAGYLPSGTYRTNTALAYDLPSGGYITIQGAGHRVSVLMAGAAMTHILKPSSTINSSYQDIFGIQFNGADFADIGIDATNTSGTTFRQCGFRFMKTDGMLTGDVGVRVENCVFIGHNIAQQAAGEGATARGIRVASAAIPNHHNYTKNTFNWCTIGFQADRRLETVAVENNSFDQNTQTGIYLSQGAIGTRIIGNRFEQCGNAKTGAEGVVVGALGTWYGSIIGSQNQADTNATAFEDCVIEGNKLLDNNHESVMTFSGITGLTIRGNYVDDFNPTQRFLTLKDTGTIYTQSLHPVIDQQSNNRAAPAVSISSADPTGNTITIASSRNLAIDVPWHVTGGSLPAPLVDGQIVFTRVNAKAQTTFELAATRGGPAIDITTTGTGTLRRLDQWGAIIDISAVDQASNTSGIVIRQHRDPVSFRGYSGRRSFGGNPSTWNLLSGTSTITKESATYEGNAIWRVAGDGGVRNLDITMENNDRGRYSMRGRAYRFSGLTRGDGGAGGLKFEFFVDTGGGFVSQVSQQLNFADWTPFRDFLLLVPWDAQRIRFAVNSVSAVNDALFTRWSLSPASIDPLDLDTVED